MNLTFQLNGKPVSIQVDADATLLDTLRRLDCHSVRCGCDSTNCGICTVWVDNTPILSCAYPAMRVEGHIVTTIEGVRDEAANLVEEMAREGADQCGFCSPGFLMSALALLRDNANPSEEEILHYLSGNLCRCTGYASQTRAILRVAEGRNRTNG